MKKKMTMLIAMLLCAILTITGICTETAYAAEKTPLKVTFKKKTVTLAKDINTKPVQPKVKTLKSKWGSPKKETYYDNEADKTMKTSESYTWTKGKTTIYYNIQHYREPMWFSSRTYIRIDSSDKNLKVNGIKVGMKQEKAEKILKNLGGNDGEFLASGIRVMCSYENGKVSYISVDLENL